MKQNGRKMREEVRKSALLTYVFNHCDSDLGGRASAYIRSDECALLSFFDSMQEKGLQSIQRCTRTSIFTSCGSRLWLFHSAKGDDQPFMTDLRARETIKYSLWHPIINSAKGLNTENGANSLEAIRSISGSLRHDQNNANK